MPYEQMKRTVAEIINYFDLQKIYHEDTDKLSGGQNNCESGSSYGNASKSIDLR